VRIAVLVKQVPRVEEMELVDGRLRRDGVELEMNAYCRRAVSKGVELARDGEGSCRVFTLGPPSAEDVLREAVAWGADEGIHLTDPAFAGSDTLATARALAAAIEREGPFDLVLVGRNSIDADTGQVGPELAELLGLPFAAGVRDLEIDGAAVEARCEMDDGWRRVRLSLPAVISTAERLTEPCKVPPEGRAEVPAERIRRLSAAELGPGPWGAAGSPTVVGAVRILEVVRQGEVLSGPPAQQVALAVERLRALGALATFVSGAPSGSRALLPRHLDGAEPDVDAVPETTGSALRSGAPVVAVLAEPGRRRTTRELLGEAVHVARRVEGAVVAVAAEEYGPDELGAWGADRVVALSDGVVEEDVADAVHRWSIHNRPWALLAPGTLWGREVAGRVAAALGAGLTGDAVGVGVEDGRLVCWKPAFGGQLVASVTATSETQLATVRPGVLALRAPRPVADPGHLPVEPLQVATRGRITVLDETRDDEVGALLAAGAVVAVGQGVAPDEYDAVARLCKVLGAELAASRKVTDKGWMPRGRQIGITGHSVAPALYVAIGLSGRFNHMVGARGAGVVLAINNDPDALVFGCSDVGIVADWHEVVPLLADALG
jgi:electron transfer flavoprotein alpha subunit